MQPPGETSCIWQMRGFSGSLVNRSNSLKIWDRLDRNQVLRTMPFLSSLASVKAPFPMWVPVKSSVVADWGGKLSHRSSNHARSMLTWNTSVIVFANQQLGKYLTTEQECMATNSDCVATAGYTNNLSDFADEQKKRNVVATNICPTPTSIRKSTASEPLTLQQWPSDASSNKRLQRLQLHWYETVRNFSWQGWLNLEFLFRAVLERGVTKNHQRRLRKANRTISPRVHSQGQTGIANEAGYPVDTKPKEPNAELNLPVSLSAGSLLRRFLFLLCLFFFLLLGRPRLGGALIVFLLLLLFFFLATFAVFLRPFLGRHQRRALAFSATATTLGTSFGICLCFALVGVGCPGWVGQGTWTCDCPRTSLYDFKITRCGQTDIWQNFSWAVQTSQLAQGGQLPPKDLSL